MDEIEPTASHTEAALRTAEEKYRSLFEAINAGYCLIELIYDDAGQPVDWRYLETNPAFERQIGIDARGKTVHEAFGVVEPFWLRTFQHVAATGEPARVENRFEIYDRWYLVYASRIGGVGSKQVAVFFDDITERKRRELNQNFLAEVADDFSRFPNPDEIMNAVGARLCAYLHLSSCFFVDVDDERGEVTVHHGWQNDELPNMQQQTYRLSDYLTEEFSRACRAGEVTAIRDTASDERTNADAYATINIGAFLIVPFHREGRWVAHLAMIDTAPRDWREDEIELVQDIADRAFPRLERARTETALRASEEHLSALFNQSLSGIAETDAQGTFVMVNDRYCEITGYARQELVGKRRMQELTHPDDLPRNLAMFRRCATEGTPFEVEKRYLRKDGSLVWVNNSVSAIRSNDGRTLSLVAITLDITERKRAEESLRESELRFRTFFENAAVGAAQITATGKFIYVNERFCQITGYPREEIVGKLGPLDLNHPDEVEEDRQRIGDFFRRGTPYLLYEKRYLHRNGHTIWVRVTAAPIRDTQGIIQTTAAIIEDITERKRAEAALWESQQRFQTLAEVSPYPIFVNLSGRIEYANRECVKLFGASSLEEIIGKSPFGFIHPDYHEIARARIAAAQATTQINPTIEEKFIRLDGSIVDVEVATASFFEKGERAILVVPRDITERKKAEQELRESETRYRTLVNATSAVTWSCPPTGFHVTPQPAWMAFTGQTAEEMIGEGWAKVLHPDDAAMAMKHWNDAIARSEPFSSEHRIRRHDGQWRWMDVAAVPIRDTSGEIVEWFGMNFDITERKQAEAALQRAHDEQAQANAQLQAKEVERRALLHQLVTVQEKERHHLSLELHDQTGQHFAALRMMLALLQQSLAAHSAPSQMLAEIQEIADQLAEETHALARELRLPGLQELGLAEALAQCVEEWSVRTQIAVDFQCSGKPQRASSLIEITLYRIVQEALTNVLKHAQAHNVSVWLEYLPDRLRTIIEDDGVGFTPEVSAASNGETARLGLRGMQERAALVEGQLEIESSPDHGTTLYVTLPLADAPQTKEKL